MSTCCTRPYGRVFGMRQARRDARRYRRKGLDETARRMVDGLAERGVQGASVLEIGGGIGSIDIELLEQGAEKATIIEISAGYDEEASTLLAEHGLTQRVARVHGDFVVAEAEVEPADVVVMHRVVCCYPDPDLLVGAAGRHARRLLVLSFPRDTWWLRLGWHIVDVWFRSVYKFRSFVHPPARILAAAKREGLQPVHEHTGRFWQIAVLERA